MMSMVPSLYLNFCVYKDNFVQVTQKNCQNKTKIMLSRISSKFTSFAIAQIRSRASCLEIQEVINQMNFKKTIWAAYW